MKPASYITQLSHAYLTATDAPRPLRIILRLCYFGIGIGALSLMLTLIIMRGFERDVSAKMKGISSDAIISSPYQHLDAAPLKKRIFKYMRSYIAGVSPSSTRYLMLERHNSHQVVFIKGINGRDEARTTTFAQKIVAPRRIALHKLLTIKNGVLVGSELAQRAHLVCGDNITVHVPFHEGGRSLSLTEHQLTVVGIFTTGLDEYDASGAVCSTHTIQQLFKDVSGADQLAVRFAPRPQPSRQRSWIMQLKGWWQYLFESQATYRARQLHKLKLLLSGLRVRGWQELYPDLVSALVLEKYAMSIILGLIALVASMLMVCLLFMFLQYKQRDIAILRALGASKHAIHRLFARLGMTIVLRACSLGLLLATSIGYWLEIYKPIKLPSVYYVTYLPAAVELGNVIIIFCITFALGIGACLIPLRQIYALRIAAILRES